MLGRAALPLYVIHLVLVVTVGQRTLGVRLNSWPEFAIATAGLIGMLVGIGSMWLALTAAARRHVPWRSDGAAASIAPVDVGTRG